MTIDEALAGTSQHALIEGDCLAVMKHIPDACIDAVITDPPYPEIDREYGRLTEAEWWALMMGLCNEVRRVLKPTGSAVFILQPNSSSVGSMRGWLFEFQAWVCREWNMVQDIWWWNPTALPTVHSHADNALTRPSVKACIWAGNPDCWRDQGSVMWDTAQINAAKRQEGRALRYSTSGYAMRDGRARQRAIDTGKSTPFNLLPISTHAGAGSNESRRHGHGASTPATLISWWIRYICPPGGLVLDPFSGSGTLSIACVNEGRRSIGIELFHPYIEMSVRRLADSMLPPDALPESSGLRQKSLLDLME